MTLTELRKRARLSIPEVAERMEVDRTIVWRWEKGERVPSIHQADRMAQVLGTTRVRVIAAILKATRAKKAVDTAATSR